MCKLTSLPQANHVEANLPPPALGVCRTHRSQRPSRTPGWSSSSPWRTGHTLLRVADSWQNYPRAQPAIETFSGAIESLREFYSVEDWCEDRAGAGPGPCCSEDSAGPCSRGPCHLQDWSSRSRDPKSEILGLDEIGGVRWGLWNCDSLSNISTGKLVKLLTLWNQVVIGNYDISNSLHRYL